MNCGLQHSALVSSCEAFYALDDPLEAALFSVLVEMLREIDKAYREIEIDLTSSAWRSLHPSLRSSQDGHFASFRLLASLPSSTDKIGCPSLWA
jgi:hypothetical protein